MAISNVKTAIYQDLQTLTTINGYSTTIKTIKKKAVLPTNVGQADCPLIAYELVECPSRPFDEATYAFDLRYWFFVHVTANADTDDSGDILDALLAIYQDLQTLFNKQTTNTFKLDEVQDIEIENFYPLDEGTKGFALIPMRIGYKH